MSKRDVRLFLSDMLEARGPDASLELNWRFHQVLAECAGNSAASKLLSLLEELSAELYRDLYHRLFASDPDRDEAAQHVEIYNAVRRRDSDGIRRLMRQHIEQSLIREIQDAYPPGEEIAE